MCNCFDVHIERFFMWLSHVAIHFSERTFWFKVIEWDFTFNNHFHISRYQDITVLAFDDFNWLTFKSSSNFKFILLSSSSFRTAHGKNNWVSTQYNNCLCNISFSVHQGFPTILILLWTDTNFSWPLNLHSIGANISPHFWINSYKITSVDESAIITRIGLNKWKI